MNKIEEKIIKSGISEKREEFQAIVNTSGFLNYKLNASAIVRSSDYIHVLVGKNQKFYIKEKIKIEDIYRVTRFRCIIPTKEKIIIEYNSDGIRKTIGEIIIGKDHEIFKGLPKISSRELDETYKNEKEKIEESVGGALEEDEKLFTLLKGEDILR